MIKLTNVINVNACWFNVPKDTPKLIIIIENSLTWARLIPVKKEVLFVYLNVPIKTKTTKGLINNTNNESKTAGSNKEDISFNFIFNPIKIKKRIRKKSLKGEILLITSEL